MLFNHRKIKWLILGLIIFANFLIWQKVWSQTERDFFILAMLDIGQGDAIFIEDQIGHQILIDGGPEQKILAALSEVMPLADRSLDLLILTHPHADHLAGLIAVLERYKVKAVLEAGAIYDSATYREWHRLLTEKGVPVIPAKQGEIVKLSGNARLEILTPFLDWRDREAKNIHDSMVTARLVIGETGVAMLTGDMETDLEAQLVRAGVDLQADVLKIGHHGSKTSSSENFVKAVGPEWAVISVGVDNRYGHPHPQTLETLKRLGVKVLRTDEEGTIIFRLTDSGSVVYQL